MNNYERAYAIRDEIVAHLYIECVHTFLLFAITYIACHILKMPHKIAAPAGMIGASNFFERGFTVAIALFGSTS